MINIDVNVILIELEKIKKKVVGPIPHSRSNIKVFLRVKKKTKMKRETCGKGHN